MSFYRSSAWRSKRKSVLRRDVYRCRECQRYGKTTDATTVHHVIPLSDRYDLRLTKENLISLCNACHEQMHDRITDKLTDLGMSWVDRLSKRIQHDTQDTT
ncbi:HNH endonuclease [Shouchella lonarensis]|uniref:HNH endonuclease n=1 Tax=Shouchella lonarensis TaxID=1464122 RepID=UPI000B8A171B|nr:HNH endonuclease signature motif containing protein [Shouchella lonarensis]